MAESSILSSILGRFQGPGNVSAPQPATTTIANGSGRPAPSPKPNTALPKSQPSTSSRPAILNGSTSAPSRPAMTSAKAETGAVIKKRKIDHPLKAESMSASDRENLERKKRLMEISLKKKEAAAAATSASSASSSNKAKSSTKALSYKDLLAQAAVKQKDKKAVAGAITHKKVTPVVEKKEWQRKFAEKGQSKDGPSVAERKSKSPGVASGGDKGGKKIGEKKIGESAKAPISRKAGSAETDKRMGLAKKPKPPERGRTEVTTKRKRDSPPPRGVGRNGSFGAGKKLGARRYDDEDEDEDDDWIVDDDEPAPRGLGSLGRRKYVYAESDSGSDMEATGVDIFEEEERSKRQAIREDMEQERLEKELALRKAKAKKGVK